MPSLSGLGTPSLMSGQYKNQKIISKSFIKGAEEIIAWYTVCNKEESSHPFAIAIVKIPRSSNLAEVYIDNKVSGASGSDGTIDIHYPEFDIDKPIVDYITRCPDNA